jgi:D-alanine-D-alanine ligase
VGVIMGGFSSERHISVESGRNIYEKLLFFDKYEPLPIFLTGDEHNHEMYVMPINVMLKDNADDIRDKIRSGAKKHPLVKQIIGEARGITEKYVGEALEYPYALDLRQLAEKVDVVFIALHGRPAKTARCRRSSNGTAFPTTARAWRVRALPSTSTKPTACCEGTASWWRPRPGVQRGLAEGPERGGEPAGRRVPVPVHCQARRRRLFFGREKDQEPGGTGGLCRNDVPRDARVPAGAVGRAVAQAQRGVPAEVVLPGGRTDLAQRRQALPRNHRGPAHALERQRRAAVRNLRTFRGAGFGRGAVAGREVLAGEGQNITPSRFSRDAQAQRSISEQVRDVLKRTAQILNVEGYARIDAFVRIFEDNRAETIIIEVNSLPGMTPATCIFHQTAINGYKPYQFIDAILEFGVRRTGKAVVG